MPEIVSKLVEDLGGYLWIGLGLLVLVLGAGLKKP